MRYFLDGVASTEAICTAAESAGRARVIQGGSGDTPDRLGGGPGPWVEMRSRHAVTGPYGDAHWTDCPCPCTCANRHHGCPDLGCHRLCDAAALPADSRPWALREPKGPTVYNDEGNQCARLPADAEPAGLNRYRDSEGGIWTVSPEGGTARSQRGGQYRRRLRRLYERARHAT